MLLRCFMDDLHKRLEEMNVFGKAIVFFEVEFVLSFMLYLQELSVHSGTSVGYINNLLSIPKIFWIGVHRG